MSAKKVSDGTSWTQDKDCNKAKNLVDSVIHNYSKLAALLKNTSDKKVLEYADSIVQEKCISDTAVLNSLQNNRIFLEMNVPQEADESN